MYGVVVTAFLRWDNLNEALASFFERKLLFLQEGDAASTQIYQYNLDVTNE